MFFPKSQNESDPRGRSPSLTIWGTSAKTLLSGLIASLIVLATDQCLASNQKGTVSVSSTPAGASIRYRKNGTSSWRTAGKSPKGLSLSPGNYQFELTRKGYAPTALDVSVQKGKKTTVARNLKKQSSPGDGLETNILNLVPPTLTAVRKSYQNRSKYTLATTKKWDFFPKAAQYYAGSASLVEIMQGKRTAGFLKLDGTNAYPGDVVVIIENDRRIVMVYAGEFMFPDEPNRFTSFFYYPYHFKSGLQLNTYPPRWEHGMLKSTGLLSSPKGKSGKFTKGKSNSKAKFSTGFIDTFDVAFLRSPSINQSRLFQKFPPPNEFYVYRPAPSGIEGLIGLLDFIGKAEGSYTATNNGTKNKKIVESIWDNQNVAGTNKPLTSLTIEEIMTFQEGTRATGRKLFAVGKYQIIPDTMIDVVKRSGLPKDTLFNEETQDILGAALLIGDGAGNAKHPALANYLTGKSNDVDKAMMGMAKEWASVPRPDNGLSYYDGTGNKAAHTVKETREALRAARKAYLGQ